MNALAAPGGKVLVFTGLLKALRSEDQLAAVLSHEVAHVIARHTVRRQLGAPSSRVFLMWPFVCSRRCAQLPFSLQLMEWMA